MNRFQYRIVNLGIFHAADRMVAAFGHLGEQGWELVAVYDKGSNWLAGMEKGFALFKRTVPAGEQPVGPWAEASHATEFPHPAATIESLTREIESLEAEQARLIGTTDTGLARRSDVITDRLAALNVQLARLILTQER